MFKINDVEVTVEQWREWSQVICDTTNEFLDKIKEKQKEIRVGDLVQVVDDDMTYTTYPEWVFKNVEGVKKCKYVYNEDCNYGMVGVVITMSTHGTYPNTMLCYVEEAETGKCYLIGIDGLEKVEED